MPTVERLRELGHDVLTSKEAGRANQRIPDEQVFDFSVAENRVLLTLNRKDFFKIHRTNPVHPGIIACTFDFNYAALAERIHQAILERGKNLENQVLRIYKS